MYFEEDCLLNKKGLSYFGLLCIFALLLHANVERDDLVFFNILEGFEFACFKLFISNF